MYPQEFGADLKLKDVPRPVFITTFYTQGRQSAVVPPESEQEGDWHPRYFSQYHEQDRDELVVDILLRSAAAPTYFPIYQGYVDGARMFRERSGLAYCVLECCAGVWPIGCAGVLCWRVADRCVRVPLPILCRAAFRDANVRVHLDVHYHPENLTTISDS